jgi:hypothetical protein
MISTTPCPILRKVGLAMVLHHLSVFVWLGVPPISQRNLEESSDFLQGAVRLLLIVSPRLLESIDKQHILHVQDYIRTSLLTKG